MSEEKDFGLSLDAPTYSGLGDLISTYYALKEARESLVDSIKRKDVPGLESALDRHLQMFVDQIVGWNKKINPKFKKEP